MSKTITVPERLFVAADFSPEGIGRRGVKNRILNLAEELKGLGVVIKINSALRALGYDLIDELHSRNVCVCADLKVTDIPHTLKFDGEFLREAKPEFVTVMCNTEIDGMLALREAIHPDTRLLGVTVFTTFDEDVCQQVFRFPAKAAVLEFARNAKLAGLWGLVASPQEGSVIKKRRELEGLNLCTPGIRYPWSEDKQDDQVRTASASFAIKSGVTCVIVGRPILNAKMSDCPDKPNSRLQAAHWILRDIEEALTAQEEPVQVKT